MSHYGLLALSLLAQGPLAGLGDGLLAPVNGKEPGGIREPGVSHPYSDGELMVEAVWDHLPRVDEFGPEFTFSGSERKKSVRLELRLPPLSAQGAIAFSFPPLPPVPPPLPLSVRPASGTQLYEQRLAALKAGQIYTRLPGDSFADHWQEAVPSPTHEQWQGLLALEARAIATGQGENSLNILVGDSLSLWFPPDQLPPGKLWLNQSVSGEATRHILQRLSFLESTQPDRIFVLAGINDLRQGVRDEVIIANWRTMVQTLRQQHPQAEIVLQSLLPTRLAAIPNERIRDLNRQLAAIAQQEGASYLDLHRWFTDRQGNLQKELTTDGIHLSRQGYGVWQQVLQDYETPDWWEQ